MRNGEKGDWAEVLAKGNEADHGTMLGIIPGAVNRKESLRLSPEADEPCFFSAYCEAFLHLYLVRQPHSGLFIAVVSSAVSNIDTAVFHMIDQAVFVVDPSAIFPLQVAG